MTTRERAVWDAFRDAKNDTDLVMHTKYQKSDNDKYQDYLQRQVPGLPAATIGLSQ